MGIASGQICFVLISPRIIYFSIKECLDLQNRANSSADFFQNSKFCSIDIFLDILKETP